jgi:hypothetical protein
LIAVINRRPGGTPRGKFEPMYFVKLTVKGKSRWVNLEKIVQVISDEESLTIEFSPYQLLYLEGHEAILFKDYLAEVSDVIENQ